MAGLGAAAGVGEQAGSESTALSRDAVFARALDIINAEGVERLTIRRLADALGVTPAAIYRHVTNKADLLDGTLDLLMRRARVTQHDEVDWRDWLRETFLRMRMTLLEQSRALALIMSRASLGPQALDVMEEIFAKLDAGGVPRAVAARVFHHLMTYTLGSITLLGPILYQAPELADPDGRFRCIRANFELLPGKEFPHVMAHAADLAATFQEEGFVADIRRIVESALIDADSG